MAPLERLRFRLRMLLTALTAKPVLGGSPEGDDAASADDKGKEDAAAADDTSDDDAGADDDSSSDEADKGKEDDAAHWRSMSRKNERFAKKAAKEKAELEAKLKEREDADKSEHEKALEKAREEAKAEALKEGEKGRRQDRLEVEATKLAAKGFKIGDGDDAKTLKFADPDDAMVYLERGIAKDEIDGDEIFDSEGKVQKDALQSALAELLDQKPHLAAEGKAPRPSGGSDAGKGAGDGKSIDEMSTEEHLGTIKRHKD